MGGMKNAYDAYTEAKRINAAIKKQEQLLGKNTSRLIRIETFSEIERYSMAVYNNRKVYQIIIEK